MKLTKEEQQMMDELESNPNVTEEEVEEFIEKVTQAHLDKIGTNNPWDGTLHDWCLSDWEIRMLELSDSLDDTNIKKHTTVSMTQDELNKIMEQYEKQVKTQEDYISANYLEKPKKTATERLMEEGHIIYNPMPTIYKRKIKWWNILELLSELIDELKFRIYWNRYKKEGQRRIKNRTK